MPSAGPGSESSANARRLQHARRCDRRDRAQGAQGCRRRDRRPISRPLQDRRGIQGPPLRVQGRSRTYFASLGPSNKIHARGPDQVQRVRAGPADAVLRAGSWRRRGQGPLTDPAYKKALAACVDASRAHGLDAVFARFKVTRSSSDGVAWLIDLVSGTVCRRQLHLRRSRATSVTVPAGFACGLPISCRSSDRSGATAR